MTGRFDYTITVHNGGPSDHAGGLHVTDTLPAGTTFLERLVGRRARRPARP